MLWAVVLPRERLDVIPADARLADDELAARLRPFVARRVAIAADVDDVVPEVLLRLQRGLPGLHDEQRLGPWVYQVARHAIVDHHRAHTHQPVPVGELVESETSADEGENEIETELAKYAASLVATLPPYREALTLVELEGLTQVQAAERVGISLSGIKSRVQRGESAPGGCWWRAARSGSMPEGGSWTANPGSEDHRAAAVARVVPAKSGDSI